ncbi:MAG: hypothetical protein WBF90_35880 [Rivularia sp. (in: cyanobacteria)]
MANTYKPVSVDVGSSRTELMQVRDDVITYFGFTISTDTNNVVTRSRKQHSRSKYDGLADTTAEVVNIERSTWQAIKRAARVGSGKAVKVPTKLTTAAENIRFVTIRFPYAANVAAISKFLYAVDAAKRPDYFIMPSGAKYPVANVTGDVNPGEEPEAPAS